MITINMDKARAIHRDNLRAARAPLLSALDTQVMRALEDGKPTDELVKRKRALRDATAYPAIDAAQTPEDLKAITLSTIAG